MEALGIYLHSLGDHWSHQECIEAADAEGEPFAPHVAVSPSHPLWPCHWTAHKFEFGDPARRPASNRTLGGILALYVALVAFAGQNDRPLYRPIPLHAEDDHIYQAIRRFVHESEDAEERRAVADELY